MSSDPVTTSPTALPRTLTGDIVELHRIAPSDVDALLELRLSSPSVVERWLSWTREDIDDLVEAAGSAGWWIHIDGEAVGFIQHYQELDPDYRHAGIDIFLVEAAQGRGAGTDAVRTLARHLIHDLDLHRLIIDPAADNAGAIRCYEKVGFRSVGIMRLYERGADGSFHDGLLMDMLAHELT